MKRSEVMEGHIYESDNFGYDREIIMIADRRRILPPHEMCTEVHYSVRKKGEEMPWFMNASPYICTVATFLRWAKRDVTSKYTEDCPNGKGPAC